MTSIDILYFYEYASRELDVACAVASILKKRGVHIAVLQWPTEIQRKITSLRPKLIVLPFCYSAESFLPLLAYWRDALYFNATWEQLFYVGNRTSKTPRGVFPIQYVLHHAWSLEYAEFLKRAGIPENHIFLNGQPAYTLYDKPYRDYYASREILAERYHLDINKKWVFFPENYNWAFYSEATLRRILSEGQSQEDMDAMRDYCERSLAVVLEWCRKAAHQTEIELLLRPRPSTTLEEFNAKVQQYMTDIPANIHIHQHESVREWILASDLIISSHSTSLIEAAIAKKPIYILDPYPMPKPLVASWHQYVVHVSTEEAFLEICKGNHPIENPGAQLDQWARQTMMSQGDSIANLADYLYRLVNGQLTPALRLPNDIVIPGLEYTPPAWLWSSYRRIRDILRYPQTGGVGLDYVKDVISEARMESRIERWGKIAAR